MWGNDFPHPEGTWPHTKEWLRNAFWDIPVDETQAILGGNAAEVYRFDADALAPLVDRIGPTPDELGQTGGETRRPPRQVGRREGRGSAVDHRDRGRRGADRLKVRATRAATSREIMSAQTSPGGDVDAVRLEHTGAELDRPDEQEERVEVGQVRRAPWDRSTSRHISAHSASFSA